MRPPSVEPQPCCSSPPVSSKQQYRALLRKAHDLGLEVLLEMHSREELEYADFAPDLCGINNRNLGSFVTDVDNSFRLAELLPPDAVKVSESGISHPDTVRALRQAGFQGFLIGENFMKAPDPGLALHQFIAALPFKDYLEVVKPVADRHDLRVIMLITPETSEERIRFIDDHTDGFIYMVSRAQPSREHRRASTSRSRPISTVSTTCS